MSTDSDSESTFAESTAGPSATRLRGWRFRISAIVVVVVLVALVLAGLPLVNPSIDARNESLCRSNLFKLHYALLAYDSVNGSLPPAYMVGPDGNPTHSWRVLILPQLDSWGIDGDAIYQAYDFSEPWNSASNRSLPTPVPESRFACPCGTEQQTTLTSYVVLVGSDTLFPGSETVALSDVPESADPILVIEITNSNIQWTEPRDLAIDDISRSTHFNSIRLSQSHAGSIRYMTARGTVGELPAGTSMDEIRRIAKSRIP